jgi:hypothetical protein
MLVDVWLVSWSTEEAASVSTALAANPDDWRGVLADLRDRDDRDGSLEVVSAARMVAPAGERGVLHVAPWSTHGTEREYLLNVDRREDEYTLSFLLRETGRNARHLSWRGVIEIGADEATVVEAAPGWGLVVSTPVAP